jgi:hypothetical protein
MKTPPKNISQLLNPAEAEFIERLGEEGWTYIKTVVDIVHEPVLILDKDLRVMAASDPFYRTFEVKPKDTKDKLLYKLGNKQWDIPALRKLLETILPEHTFFKGFEVAHEFPFVGRKVVLLNAREIYPEAYSVSKLFPPVILLVIEDVTDMMLVAQTLASHSNKLEAKHVERTEKMEIHIEQLEKEINEFKKKGKK